MSTAPQQDLRYPVGPWQKPEHVSETMLQGYINDIRAAAGALRKAVGGLSTDQIDTAYRPGGWTVRQVVHHLADSHMNAFCRWKLALTEQNPTIKPYDENAWAKLPDSNLDISPSLAILEGVHHRWMALLQDVGKGQLARTLNHPERGTMRLDTLLSLYSWHSRHHVGHITELRKRMGW
jgi:uncharacterized damage-inducible protein DinB